jgi:hypothetical protein
MCQIDEQFFGFFLLGESRRCQKHSCDIVSDVAEDALSDLGELPRSH